jgi:hypothetical protein
MQRVDVADTDLRRGSLGQHGEAVAADEQEDGDAIAGARATAWPSRTRRAVGDRRGQPVVGFDQRGLAQRLLFKRSAIRWHVLRLPKLSSPNCAPILSND